MNGIFEVMGCLSLCSNDPNPLANTILQISHEDGTFTVTAVETSNGIPATALAYLDGADYNPDTGAITPRHTPERVHYFQMGAIAYLKSAHQPVPPD